MERVLVTGGAGFIGSNLVDALLAQGYGVRVLDNFSTGRRENLAAVLSDIELIEGDLTALKDVRNAVDGVDAILHQGAVPSVPKSVQDPLTSNNANVTGTLHVLVAAHDAGVRRVVYASSSSVYGDQAPDAAKVEAMTPQPISPYGVAKLAAEHYMGVFHHVYGLETVSLRYFNVFGPRQNPSSAYAAVIPKFITMLLNGQPPTIYGDGEQTRDFTFIGNVVAGNLHALTAPAPDVAGEVFNQAKGGQTSLNELEAYLQRITGQAVEPVYTDPRPGYIKHSRAAVDKFRQAGFEPSITLEEGLRQTVAWYRQHAVVD
ncbi:MAG: SDR family oxidoreductase [Anaerolineae bacterium]